MVGSRISLLHIQTGSSAHLSSYQMGIIPGSLSVRVRLQVSETDHAPLASAEVKKIWIYMSTPPYVSRAQCLIAEAQGQVYHFTFMMKACSRHQYRAPHSSNSSIKGG
jgi:hypothetical protein